MSKPQLKQLARKYGIKKLYVFGSIARGESSNLSDVDFLVEMKPGSSLFGVGGFGYEAQQLLDTPFLRGNMRGASWRHRPIVLIGHGRHPTILLLVC